MGRENFNIKEEICEIGKLMYDRGYVVSNDGNISVKVSENEIIITPSGVSKGRMTPDMMVKVDGNGNILEGNRYPSSEMKMHLAVYLFGYSCPSSGIYSICCLPEAAGSYVYAGNRIKSGLHTGNGVCPSVNPGRAGLIKAFCSRQRCADCKPWGYCLGPGFMGRIPPYGNRRTYSQDLHKCKDDRQWLGTVRKGAGGTLSFKRIL